MVSAWAKARVTRPENPRKKTADFSGNLRKLLDFKGKSMLMKNLFIWPDGVEYVFVFLNRQGELVWWCWWWWCFCLSIFLSLETWKTEAIGGGGHFLFDEARVYFVGQKSNKKAATPVRSLGQQSWNLFLEMYPEFKYEWCCLQNY